MRVRLPPRIAVVIGLTVSLVCGCGHGAVPNATSTTATTRSAVTPTTVDGPNDAAMSAPPAPVPPTQDATSSAAAVDLAQRAMTAFARPTVDAETWLTELSPLLTPGARSAYVGTDPDEVPAHAVTGPGRAEDSPSAFLAYVVVPTDVGDYRLLLSREGGDAGWLVETITAPDGVR